MRSANAACAAFAVSYMRPYYICPARHAQGSFGEFSKCSESLKTLLTEVPASIPDLYLDVREFHVRNISRNSRRNTNNARFAF